MAKEAKQKAIEIFEKCYNTSISTVPVTNNEAKEISILVINETIDMLKLINSTETESIGWLKEVKKELQNL